MRFPFGTITLLGAVTIAAYGAWYYAFGVLLDPILLDTGWPESWLTGSFAAATALGGLAAVPAGRMLDALGSRPVFVLAAVVSTAALWMASAAGGPGGFVAGSIVGGAALGALGFYHITQTTAVRVAPHEPARAIALLTIYGAFASTIYLPLAAHLVAGGDWRSAIRIMTAITGATLLVAAVFVRAQAPPDRRASGGSFRVAARRPEVRRYVAGTGLIGVAAGIILVYQVPLMTAAGLSLGTAAWFAGGRGAAQVAGRVPIPWMVGRWGARRSLRVAFTAIGVGLATLAAAGNPVVAGLYVVIAGFGIGATSPLQGIYADELFERANLGASMGMVTMVFGLAGALGPATVGVLADATGSRWWGVVIGTTTGLAAAWMLRPAPSPEGP